MPREPLVHVRVVRGHQFNHAAILAQLRVDERPCLLAEGVAQVLVEFRIRIDIRHHAGELAERQPLHGEVVDERLRAGIGEHAAHLLFERRAIAQRQRGE